MADTTPNTTNVNNAPAPEAKAEKKINKIVTYDAMISYSLFFNIKNGVLHWNRNEQLIYIENFKLSPDVGLNTVKMIADYPNMDIVPIFDEALSFGKDQLRKYIRSSVNTDAVENQQQQNKQVTQPQPKPQQDVNYVNESVQLTKEDIEAKYNQDKNFTLPDDKKGDKIIKSDFNNPDDAKKFILQYADEIKQNGLQSVLDKYISQQYTLWDDNDRQNFKAGVNLALDELHTKNLENINTEQKPEQTKTNPEQTSDDIYQGRDPKTFKHIWEVQNDAEILIFVKNLKVKREFSYELDKTKSFNIELNPQDISLDIISYLEAKKTKVMINNTEIRPKSELGFLQHILPSIKIEILLNK